MHTGSQSLLQVHIDFGVFLLTKKLLSGANLKKIHKISVPCIDCFCNICYNLKKHKIFLFLMVGNRHFCRLYI